MTPLNQMDPVTSALTLPPLRSGRKPVATAATKGPRAFKHIMSVLLQFSYVVLSRCSGKWVQSDAGKRRIEDIVV